ncbi:iron-containing alcohol dehydrogenase [Thermodesulfobacteriota bacterium]
MMRFDAKTQLIVSIDLTDDIWKLIQEEQASSVGLMVDSNLADHKDIQNLREFLEKKVALHVQNILASEPTTDMVNEYSSIFRVSPVDLFIAIGGGSVIDLTKAVSVMVVNEGIVEDYHGTGKPFLECIKKIAVPTTAGTGSEVTPGAVLVNTTTNFKRGLGGRQVSPEYAVLYAPLTMTMPDSITASTGMDALGHAVESYTAKNANDVSRMYSRQAFSMVFNNLNKLINCKEDIELREKILLGSSLAGFAIYNSNTGACHSMAYALGIYHQIPHGLAVAHLLPKVVKINIEKGCFIYGDLYNLIEEANPVIDNKLGSEKFLDSLEYLSSLLQFGKTFSDFGVSAENNEFLAERGLDLTPALNNNPVQFTLDDAKRVLMECI